MHQVIIDKTNEKRFEIQKNTREKLVINSVRIDGKEMIGFVIWYWSTKVNDWRPDSRGRAFAVDFKLFKEEAMPILNEWMKD